MSNPRDQVFATIRTALGSNPFNNPQHITDLNALLDRMGFPPSTPLLTTNAAGIQIMKDFEGYARVIPNSGGAVEAYPDPGTGGDPWTIGWGSTGIDPFNGGMIRRGTRWTRAQADARFESHLREFEAGVRSAVTHPATTANQFSAMVSLTYNIGLGAFRGSTLLRRHNAGDFQGARAEFARWNRAGGRVMAGLSRRRAAEAELYGRRP